MDHISFTVASEKRNGIYIRKEQLLNNNSLLLSSEIALFIPLAVKHFPVVWDHCKSHNRYDKEDKDFLHRLLHIHMNILLRIDSLEDRNQLHIQHIHQLPNIRYIQFDIRNNQFHRDNNQ